MPHTNRQKRRGTAKKSNGKTERERKWRARLAGANALEVLPRQQIAGANALERDREAAGALEAELAEAGAVDRERVAAGELQEGRARAIAVTEQLILRHDIEPKFKTLRNEDINRITGNDRWINGAIMNALGEKFMDINSNLDWADTFQWQKLESVIRTFRRKNMEGRDFVTAIHVNNNHWKMTIVKWNERSIVSYDTLGEVNEEGVNKIETVTGNERTLLTAMRVMSGHEEWSWIEKTLVMQTNTWCCGFLTLMSIALLAIGEWEVTLNIDHLQVYKNFLYYNARKCLDRKKQ